MSKFFHSDSTKLYKDSTPNQQAQSQKESQPLLQKSASPSIPQKDQKIPEKPSSSNNVPTDKAAVQAPIPDQASQLSNMASHVSELKLGEYMIHVSFI